MLFDWKIGFLPVYQGFPTEKTIIVTPNLNKLFSVGSVKLSNFDRNVIFEPKFVFAKNHILKPF